jgi:serine/threonine protein kinase
MTTSPSTDLLRRDALGDHFEAAWQRGERPRIEAFLAEVEEGPARDRLFRHLLGIEVELRLKLGETISPAEYAARFPERRRIVHELTRPPAGKGNGLTTFPDPFPGEFEILALLGRGGFGEVWMARDLHIVDRLVAMKTLKRRDHSAETAHALEVLRNDASRLARLRHRNLVSVLAWRQREDQHFLILEYVSGGSLADRLKWGGPLDWPRAARFVADVADALALVHRQGLVHRDVKPANILWDPDADEARLTDFGLAALREEAKGFAGTLPYMAPEAMRGLVGPKGDVYGLAATLFELITGQWPFPGPEPGDFLDQKVAGLPAGESRMKGWPARLEALVREGLDPDPERRISLDAFLDTLRALLNQALTDDLVGPRPGASPVDVSIFCEVRPASFEPLPIDPQRVATLPLQTGDRLRLDLSIHESGHVTVFNIGPTGNLNRLMPEGPESSPIAVTAGSKLSIDDIELMPPSGYERLCVLWTRGPYQLEGQALHQAAHSTAYVATRDLKRVRRDLTSLPADAWHSLVVALDHRRPE